MDGHFFWVVINPNAQKSYKNYLQNMAPVVLRNRPTLSVATERLTCLNNSRGRSWGLLPSKR